MQTAAKSASKMWPRTQKSISYTVYRVAQAVMHSPCPSNTAQISLTVLRQPHIHMTIVNHIQNTVPDMAE